MIEYRNGNIFEAETEAITNTVNCIGVMGKGLALQFKKLYPEMYKAYVEACERGEVRVGKVWLWENNKHPRWIVNFPTKNDWRNPSEYMYIVTGLAYLNTLIIQKNIKSLALPALGCANGELAWDKVKVLIESFHKTLPEDFKLVVYEPMTPWPVTCTATSCVNR